MSDARATPWQPDPLLARTPARTPSFVRMPWDEGNAQAFGPWRMQDKADPMAAQTEPAKNFTSAGLGLEPADPANTQDDGAAGDAPGAAPTSPASHALSAEGVAPEGSAAADITEQQLQDARDQAYAQGLKDGLHQAHLEGESERQKERETLRSLMIELRALEQNPQRYFEPLRRLALHLAEQLVRGELSVSGQAVDRLIKACLDDLGSHDKAVVVMLNPADMQHMQALNGDDQQALQMEADPSLLPGSVRVRAHDTEIQDFIEHRLGALARRVLNAPEAWMKKSSLLHPHEVEPMPESAPKRNWFTSKPDIQDAPAKSSDAPENPHVSENINAEVTEEPRTLDDSPRDESRLKPDSEPSA